MRNARPLRLAGPSGTQEAQAAFGPVGERCLLTVTLEDGRSISAEESDYFESLLSVRRQLSATG